MRKHFNASRFCEILQNEIFYLNISQEMKKYLLPTSNNNFYS